MDWCENIAEIESLVKVKVTCYCNQPGKKSLLIKKTKEAVISN